MKRPAFQWYPGDFHRDVALRACSFYARSLWREMLDLMHDGQPYGHLTAGGVPLTHESLATLIGVQPAKVLQWLEMLESRKVFSRTESGIIYSRRMVRDEALRNRRAAGGKLGGNPALKDNIKVNLTPNLLPTPAVCGLLSASASKSESGRTEPEPPGSLSPAALAAEARLLDAFYASASETRRADVRAQIRAARSPSGARLSRKAKAFARTDERLIAKVEELLAEGARDPDKAIRILLLKLGDESDITPPGVLAAAVEQDQRALEDRYHAEKETAGAKWAAEHRDEAAAMRARILHTNGQPASAFAEVAAATQLTQLLAKAANFPSFEQWRVNHIAAVQSPNPED